MNERILEIGLIGGLSFPSTITYYDQINRLANKRLGKAHSPRIIIDSLDFQPVADWLTANDGEAVTKHLIDSAVRLANAGAKCVAMCCNTVHKYAEVVREMSPIPLINICECTAADARGRDIKTVGLLGSCYTMEEDFYRNELEQQGIAVVVPGKDERSFIQHVIETELSLGTVSPETKARFISIANGLVERGVQAIILACTEIPLVIQSNDVAVPLIDTVDVHSKAIVEFAMHSSNKESREKSCVAHI